MKNFFLFIIFLLSSLSIHIFASPVSSRNAMVVTEQRLASQVGIDILKQGGNAIDAAVAVGYALAVVNPCCGNIGGGGFMLIRFADGKSIFINFREKAPLAAKSNLFLDENGNIKSSNASTQGYLAVATPGTVMGLDNALKKYGTLTRKQVMAPAIRLAEQGYNLSQDDVLRLSKMTEAFRQQPNIAAIFLKNNQPYQVGDRLVQKNLAKTLKEISDQGPNVFYKGNIAKSIVKASQENHGILSLKDFSQYHIQEMKPIQCSYQGYSILSAPPPSSGGVTLCEMLNILEGYPLKKTGYHTVESAHYMIEAMRYAFKDRNNQLGDPDFVNNPIELLTSKKYAATLRKKIDSSQTFPSTSSPVPEKLHTTHYSIIDKWGNAVAVTYTINGYFGAGVIAGDTGFFLNNEMDDFAVKPGLPNQFGLVQSEKNNIQPGKRPLSSMTPTIIFKNNKPVLIVGSPGGSRIITSVLETITNVLDYGLDIQAAVDAPRFHHQWLPDWVEVESGVFSTTTSEKLKNMGYTLKQHEPWSAVEAIYIDPKTHVIYGGSDKRRTNGAAVGIDGTLQANRKIK